MQILDISKFNQIKESGTQDWTLFKAANVVIKANRTLRYRLGALGAVVAVGAALAGQPMSASAAPVASPAKAAVAHPAQSAGGLTLAQAAARAHSNGRPVTVTSLTTPDSLTTASPAGRFTTTQTLLPVRAFRDGAWRPLNATLSRSGHRLVPAVTMSPVSLSDGGSGPIAEMSSLGRTLSWYWPGALPTPAISGATATYANVPVQGANLIVTATTQGGISTVIEVMNATAAASRALQSITLTAVSPGLTASTDTAGDISFQSDAAGEPVFSTAQPRVWDSAPLPAGTKTVTDPASGAVLVVPSGLPAVSGTSGPSAAAHVSAIQVAVSGQAITLTPKKSALTGRGVVYPVFLDPSTTGETKYASAWTQIDSNTGVTGDYNESGCNNGSGGPCLQVGFCDGTAPGFGGCSIGITRTMIEMPLPTGLPHNITVDTADLYLEDVWSATCSAEPIELWTTGGISKSTEWPATWDTEEEEETFGGYGYSSSCGYTSFPDVKFGSETTKGATINHGSTSSLGGVISGDLDRTTPATSQGFGLRAGNESTTPCDWNGSSCAGGGSAWLQWRQFMDKSSNMELQFSWNNPPNEPTGATASPGAAGCHTSSDPATIGNDDVTLTADGVADQDGDTNLTTTFKVYANDTGALMTNPPITVVGKTGTVSASPISRATIQAWQANGSTTTYGYHFTVAVTNSAPTKQTGATFGPCYFNYEPTGSGAPNVTVAGGAFPSSVTFGQTVSDVVISPAVACGGSTGVTCPESYSYKVGDLAPVTLTSAAPGSGTWDTADGTWTGSIPINVLGPLEVTVGEINSAGNPSTSDFSAEVDSTLSGTTLANGYFTDGAYPDLLTNGSGTGAGPSLWLSEGTANGKLAPPVDIGTLGNGISAGSSAADGPADWTGASILQDDFSGHGVQDVMAYWPTSATIGGNPIAVGSGTIVAGTGAPISVDPVSGFWATNPVSSSQWNISAGSLCDPTVQMLPCETGLGTIDSPIALTSAGNACEQPNTSLTNCSATYGFPDLIGILGDSSTSGVDGYTLDLFAANAAGAYSYATTLAGVGSDSPDGTVDWQDYALAAAELPDSASAHGDPDNIELFALNKTTGNLYASVNDGCLTGTCSATALVGTAGTWEQISAPWGASPPTLLTADVNAGSNGPGSGLPELWTQSGSNATAYEVSGTWPSQTLTAESTSSLVPAAKDEWALTDGDPAREGTSTSPNQALDSVTGVEASVTGSFGWTPDQMFSTVLDTENSSPNVTVVPPAGTLTATKTDPSISLWFRTSTAGGVLASISSNTVASGSTIASGYNPVLYIGNDGKLYAEWWTGSVAPITTSAAVDDGLWHYVQLVTSGTTQTLYVDGKSVGTLSGTVNLTAPATENSSGVYINNFTIGGGFIGGSWPNEADYKKSGNTGYRQYFNGQISSVTLSY